MSRLARARNIADLRLIAKARLPRMVFDYIDGGADDEVTLRKSVERFRAHELVWDALIDVASVDTRTKIMGADIALPFVISPTAASRLFHKDGEMAVAKAAAKHGTAYSAATLGSFRLEEIAAAIPTTPKWFQIYIWKDRGIVREMMARAKAAGYTAAALTVDVPIAGNRERDPKNWFSIPPRVNWKTATQTMVRPGYVWDLLTTAPIRPVNVPGKQGSAGGIAGYINEQFDRSVTWKDAEMIAAEWGSYFAIKGITHAEDARRCLDHGATCVWVSNHGGRQLDTAPATIDVLPEIVEAVRGRAEIVLDGGIRRGTDIAKALCLGANAVAIGRAYLFGLAAGGEAGVDRALTILKTEFQRTMMLMGVTKIADLHPRFVRKPR